MDNTSQTVAKILLKIKAVTLNPKKPYKYTSGMLSPVYTDNRILMSYTKQRKKVRDFYVKAIKQTNIDFDVIAGTATAGIPHAAWVAYKLNLPMVYVRSSAKEHGKGNQIEGLVKKGQKVAVIEDLITTGGSSIETTKALRKAGCKVTHIFAIITYDTKQSTENFKNNKLKLVVMTTFQDVVVQALKMGYINKEEMPIILEWIKDPPSWGKRIGFE